MCGSGREGITEVPGRAPGPSPGGLLVAGNLFDDSDNIHIVTHVSQEIPKMYQNPSEAKPLSCRL